MSVPSYPSAAEVREIMQRMRPALARLDELQRAQIAQALFDARVADKHVILLSVLSTLYLIEDSIKAYRGLLGVQEGDTVDPILEGGID